MEKLNDLTAIWQSVPLSGLPSSIEILKIIKKDRSAKLRQLVRVNAAALILILMMLAVAFLSPATFLITKIGVGLILFAGIIMAGTNLNSLYRFYNLTACSNIEYIAFLKQTKLRQLFYFTKTQPLVMCCASIGLFFYWYELSLEKPTLGIAIYIGFLVYFIILWFYVRPKIFKREQHKLNKSIAHINKISKQF